MDVTTSMATATVPAGTAEEAATVDDALMERVKEGDEVAFARLVGRYQRRLVAYLGRLTGDFDRAEDLAQEAFVRLYEHAGRYQGRGRLAAYLYRIAANLVRSQERRRRRWRLLQPLFTTTVPTEVGPTAQHRVLQSELHQRLQEELARLPLPFREPLVLAEIEEWSYAEIAELLGCREGTVKSRIFRGRRRLREALRPYVEGGA